MTKKVTRKRWRRPARLTLDGPAPSRRKDLVVPDFLTLEPARAFHENRRRMAGLLTVFLVACAVVGLGVATLFGATWLGPGAGIAGGFLFLAASARLGDGWLADAVHARPCTWPEGTHTLAGLAEQARTPQPRLVEVTDAAPNGLTFGLRRRWLVVTTGLREVDVTEREAVLAQQVIHLRDGDAALASVFAVVSGAPELAMRLLPSVRAFPLLLAVPLWPACLLVRAVGSRFFPADREHRADVAAAMLTRYPPAMRDVLLRATAPASVASISGLDRFWFAPTPLSPEHDTARRPPAVAEM